MEKGKWVVLKSYEEIKKTMEYGLGFGNAREWINSGNRKFLVHEIIKIKNAAYFMGNAYRLSRNSLAPFSMFVPISWVREVNHQLELDFGE